MLLGQWDSADYSSTPQVYIHHSEDDENAPVESIQALPALLPKMEIRLSKDASHVALATDEALTEMQRSSGKWLDADSPLKPIRNKV